MPITITAFACSPDEGHGHARDMRLRWALDEVARTCLSNDPCRTFLLSRKRHVAQPSIQYIEGTRRILKR